MEGYNIFESRIEHFQPSCELAYISLSLFKAISPYLFPPVSGVTNHIPWLTFVSPHMSLLLYTSCQLVKLP